VPPPAARRAAALGVTTFCLFGLVSGLAASPAAARAPLISYVEDGTLRLFDAEVGVDVAAPPIEIPGLIPRYSISLNGRFVFWLDDAMPKQLHLFDRASGEEVALPGIDVYTNPGGLTVSEGGLVAFDDNGNGPTLAYDPGVGDFVDSGLDAMNGHRQSRLSGDGRFLATTCVTGCEVDLGGDASAYVQDLAGGVDTGFPDDLTGADDEDEEHPCVNGDGSLVGIDITNPMQRDIFLYDRTAGAAVSLPGLNDPMKEDTSCVIDEAGEYIGYLFDNDEFRVYERSSGSLLVLEPRPFATSSTFSAPYPPPPSVDDEVGLKIASGEARVSRRGKVKVKVKCPAKEVSPPCAGKLKLKTRKKVRMEGERRRRTLTRPAAYSLEAGQSEKLKLKLSKRKLRLVRRQRKARDAEARTRVSDAAGNAARESARLKLKPK
jgi:hypothetical protein